jgi:hypothetical protein
MSAGPRSDAAPASYEALEAVIRRELAAVAARELEHLPAIKRERAWIVKRLAPGTPPADARAALERCLTLQDQVAAELQVVRGAIVEDLARVRQARRAAAGYAPVRAAHPRVATSA